MKVIDLLNKIANGEISEDTLIEFDNGYKDYCSVRVFFDRYIMDRENLNCEVELLENKKIRKLDFIEENTFSKRQNGMTSEDRRLLDSNFKELEIKINEIIDYLEENK